ncbi:MAG: hypothetical protein HY457_02395 [Parcubacteria group bacterium]|nr:hypothetical protein [Parcubacteria group bacterium]
MNLSPKTIHPKPITCNLSSGFGLLEIVISSAIISASLIALVTATQLSYKAVERALQRTQAEFLAEEGFEAIRTLRDAGWSAAIAPLINGTSYYPIFATSTSVWSLSPSDPGLKLGLFTRTVVFTAVCRKDADDDIVDCDSATPHYTDQGTREVVSRVEWGDNEEVEFRGYITDLLDN